MDDVLHRPACHLVGRQRLARGRQKSRQQLILADPDGVGDPVTTGKQIGDDRNLVSVGTWKQNGTVALKTLGDRSQFVGKADAFAGNREPATSGKMGKPCPQIGRRVGLFPCKVFSSHMTNLSSGRDNRQGTILRNACGRRFSASSSPQRRTMPTSTSNKSSTRPTVWSTISSRFSGLA